MYSIVKPYDLLFYVEHEMWILVAVFCIIKMNGDWGYKATEWQKRKLKSGRYNLFIFDYTVALCDGKTEVH